MAVIDKIKNLTSQLLPTGRAFKMPYGGVLQKLRDGVAVSEAQYHSDLKSILDSALPDNNNFTVDDATDWERRLGLITSDTDLENRKLAIIRKMNHPGEIPARQNYKYIEGQLQAAGFDVYLYENIFYNGYGGYVTKTPTAFSLLPYPTTKIRHSGGIQHGNVRHGLYYANKIANHIEQSYDDGFDLGSDLFATFFVGGSTAGSWTNVEATRKDEFRQLILRLKPVQTVGFLLVNYV